MRFLAGFLAGCWVTLVVADILINCGKLPSISTECPNGRIVYLQKGYTGDSDKALLCEALQ